MIGEHYDGWELVAFIEGDDAVVDVRAVAAHVEDCETCRERLPELRTTLRLLGDKDIHAFASRKRRKPLPSYVADAQALVRRFAAEEAAAAHTYATLLRQPMSAWPAYLASWPGLQTEGLVRRLVAAAREDYDRDAAHALRVLDVATGVANALPNAWTLAEQRVLLAKERANALRMLGRYPEALEALDEADRFMRDAPIGAIERALILWARATVLFAMTQYADALSLAREAARIFRLFGEHDRAHQVTLLEAGILYEMGEPERALGLFEALAPHFTDEDAAESAARIAAGRAECEMRLKRYTHAREHAEEAIRQYHRLLKPSEIVRAEWTLAHVLLGEGQEDRALDQLHSVATRFEALGMMLDAGGALLDIVEIYVLKKQWDDAAPLARYLAGLFTAVGASMHAATAYAHLREAVEARRATLPSIQYIRHYARLPAGVGAEFAPPG